MMASKLTIPLLVSILISMPLASSNVAFAEDPVLYVLYKDGLLELRDLADYSLISSVTITLPGQTVQRVHSIAFDKSGSQEVLYAVVQTQNAGEPINRLLVTVNAATGVSTEVGELAAAIAEITFNDTGALYAVSGIGSNNNPSTLFTVDKTDATLNEECSVSEGSAGQTIAFNPFDGLLYHSTGHSADNTAIFETLDLDNSCNPSNIFLDPITYDELSALTFLIRDDSDPNSPPLDLLFGGDTSGRLHTIGVLSGLGFGFTSEETEFPTNGGTTIAGLALGLPPPPNTNNPPVAVAQDVIVAADSNCQADVTAQDVDAGSNDPDGDPITLDLNPLGPYVLGDTLVSLTATDPSGLSDTDDATISVEDTTGPEVTASLEPVEVKKKQGLFTVQIGASDNCDSDVSLTANINGVPVENGNLVLLKLDEKHKDEKHKDEKHKDDDKHKADDKSYSDKQCGKFQKQADRYEDKGKNIPDKLKEKLLICNADGLIKIEDSSFTLTAIATDDSGNESSATADPEFGNDSNTQKISGTFVGEHDDGEFSTKGNYKIGDHKFKRIVSSGEYEIDGDSKCNPLSATNTLVLDDENKITMQVNGELCGKKHLGIFKGTFTVIDGDGEYEQATGDGMISLIIGKKHFGGKISGEVSLS